jgi:hypothetical protein
MDKRTVILKGPDQRALAHRLIDEAPDGFCIIVQEPTRTQEQNAKLWPMIADVRRAQCEGRKWIDETWKCGFMALAGHQTKFEMGLDGTSAFPLGFRSSLLGKRDFANLVTVIYEYGDRHGVQWSEPNPYEGQAA